MIHIKKISLCITLVVLTIMMGGCGLMSNKNEIKESFEEKLSMYPIKNLEDFYDKEGVRDSEFDKNDKGKWILYSEMGIKRKTDDRLIVKAMVLHMNRNTKTSHGEYIIRYLSNGPNENDDEERYPVKLENNKITPTKVIKDKKVIEEIEEFKFFVQFANFKDLSSYGQGNFEYNPNVPSYSAEYQLSNDNYNVKQLRKRYDIPTNKAPKLKLKGVGEFKGSSVGYKDLEINFVESENESIFYSDLVDFKPSGDGK
ncbi:tandem-type lipoprotein [Staphylococcus hyicus]|uniref:tandem-type lipoprotein n=2 Tax=Staphylococcus hyicus TaxID=1284 RepID=UPI00142F4664|nr:tandem-type lipoprotein [Staphylococcus hyicus]NJH80697.1 tandem-type lipoprotein [Staphylococcus hyicus]NJH99386.1 tandem-type lipoprotein [Staphylococcus hyicus]NJI30278.1 tandem-type lipoprotein [Staphylococcus hyicus]